MAPLMTLMWPLVAAGQSAPPTTNGGAGVTNVSQESLSRINDNVVSIMAGGPASTSLLLAADMGAVLDTSQLRILPMVGKGGGQNVLDLLKLRGVDLAITQTDILKHFRRTVPNSAALLDPVRYIARLHNEELHILSKAGIANISALAGKAVNLGEVGSSEDISGRLVFALLRIPVQAVNVGQADALQLMKSGQVDATVMITSKPSPLLQALPTDSGFHLLSLPLTEALEEDYLPAELTNADYPALAGKGERIETIAVGSVLITFDWPKDSDRYRRVARFVTQFFNNVGDFQKPPRHPGWRDINLAASVPDWRRIGSAQEWLDNRGKSGPRGVPQR